MCNLHFPFHSNLKVLYKLSRISPRAVVTWTRLEPQGLWTIQRRDSRSEFCTDKPTDAPARRLVVWGGSSCTQASLRLYIPHCTVVTEEQMCTGGFSWCQYGFSVFDFMSLTAWGGGGGRGVWLMPRGDRGIHAYRINSAACPGSYVLLFFHLHILGKESQPSDLSSLLYTLILSFTKL